MNGPTCLPAVLNFPDRPSPHRLALSGSPVVGRKRAPPRKPDTWKCRLRSSNRYRAVRSGYGYSALPGTLVGIVMLDLLSSSATAALALSLIFLVNRTCAWRTDANAIGDSKSI